jgi:hypothetical protein
MVIHRLLRTDCRVNANYLLFYTGLAIIVAMTANVYVGRVRRGHGSG